MINDVHHLLGLNSERVPELRSDTLIDQSEIMTSTRASAIEAGSPTGGAVAKYFAGSVKKWRRGRDLPQLRSQPAVFVDFQ